MNFNLCHSIFSGFRDHDKTAYRFRGQDISFREVVDSSLSTAKVFKAQGLKADDRIILMQYDTPAFVASFLGAIAIGVIPVPVNPRLKRETLAYILKDSLAAAIVVEADVNADILPILAEFPKLRTLIDDRYTQIQVPVPAERLMTSLLSGTYGICSYDMRSERSPTFWQYTSGTTGHPKAVIHTGSGMIENTRLFADQTLGMKPTDKIYSIPKMFFGYGLGNSLFFPLILNTTAVLDDQWPTLERVTELLRTERPTVFFGVPAIYSSLLSLQDQDCMQSISSLRICFSAGSKLPDSTFDSFRSKTGLSIYDGIGATELGHVFLTNSAQSLRPGTTGKVVQGYELRLESRDEGEAARQEGVLWVKGPSVSLGYWNHEAANQIKFSENWYRTGDIFHASADGYYTYRGREDDHFKVKGRWIVPLEIEQLVLSEFKDISEAVVVPMAKGAGGPDGGETTPTMFITTAVNQPAHQNDLVNRIQECLAGRLSSYQIPTRIQVIDKLPRNDNGKIVRHQLIQSRLEPRYGN